jgi:N-acetylmuramoyl-L-alanine amidase
MLFGETNAKSVLPKPGEASAMKAQFLVFALLSALALSSGFARADSSSDDFAESERLRKFELALKTLGIPIEKEPDYSAFPDAGTVSTSDILAIAPFIDPDGGLRRYLSISSSRLELFPSFFNPNGTNDPTDYELATGATTSQDSPELLSRLDRISRATLSGNRINPFAGLRVVIDPGHMGTAFWNDKDGKFVKVGGKTVAEGELTLWTAKLLANELEKLGATVLLTRTDLVPVTHYTWDNFDPAARKADYYYKSRDDWMTRFLTLSDSDLVRLLPRAPEVQKMSTYAGKVYLYLQEDMDARAKFAAAANPDLFIDIHFDSQLTDKLQNNGDDVSVYVPGAVRKNETGPKNMRADLLKHLVDVRRWKQSARMAKFLVDQVSKNLGVKLLTDASSVPTTVKVVDGVFARNIFETKRATTGLSAFFEAFHYDYVKEWPLVKTSNKSATYHGKPFRYPSRLEAISTGIRDGLLTYFREFKTD